VNSTRFLASFLVLFFVPFALIHVVPMGFANEAVAGSEEFLLSTLGYQVEQSGSLLRIGAESYFDIIADCTGAVMVILFFALLYSTPCDCNRLRALAIYSPLLLGFNLLRLLVTLLTHYHYGLAAFDLAHVALWFVDSGVVLACWSHATGVKLW